MAIYVNLLSRLPKKLNNYRQKTPSTSAKITDLYFTLALHPDKPYNILISTPVTVVLHLAKWSLLTHGSVLLLFLTDAGYELQTELLKYNVGAFKKAWLDEKKNCTSPKRSQDFFDTLV